MEVQVLQWQLKEAGDASVLSSTCFLRDTQQSPPVINLMLRTIRRSLETETTHKKEYEQEVETHQSPLQDYFAVQHAGRSVSSRSEETVPIAWAKKKRSFEFLFVLHAIGNPVLGARGNLCLKPVATFCLNVSHLRGMTWPFGPLQNSEWSLEGQFFLARIGAFLNFESLVRYDRRKSTMTLKKEKSLRFSAM